MNGPGVEALWPVDCFCEKFTSEPLRQTFNQNIYIRNDMGNVDGIFESYSLNNDHLSTLVRDFEYPQSELFPDGTSSLPELQPLFDNGNDPFLWESDSQSTVIDSDSTSNSSEKSSCSTSLLNSDGKNDINVRVGIPKNWYIFDQPKIGHSYDRISADPALPWKDHSSKQTYFNYTRCLDDLSPSNRDSMNSDADSVEGARSSQKRRPGRPRKINKSPQKPCLKLWQFLRNILHNPKYCPGIIRWEDYDQKIFRLVKNVEVAELWGKRCRNSNRTAKLTYENFSRAMRYHYKTGIIMRVPNRKLVYKFGKNATGLETDFPNFN